MIFEVACYKVVVWQRTDVKADELLAFTAFSGYIRILKNLYIVAPAQRVVSAFYVGVSQVVYPAATKKIFRCAK